VPAWAGNPEPTLHATLAAIWIWARADALAGRRAFAEAIAAGWRFVRAAWPELVPRSLGAQEASDEAAYDCALVLRAALASPPQDPPVAEALPERAARLLGAHLGELDVAEPQGRAFADTGFLAWNAADYARGTQDRGLLSVVCRFVDGAFGTKAPPPFAAEPPEGEGLFDFTSTCATRVLALLASEGDTPLIGAWLRERVAPLVPAELLPRPRDENAWNACVALMLGRAFVISTDETFLRAHRALMSGLERRISAGSGLLANPGGPGDDTNTTFLYALALDALSPS
jgi:hypothetical protein